MIHKTTGQALDKNAISFSTNNFKA